MILPSTHRPLAAHVWDKEPDGFYIEPIWCSVRLFATEQFNGAIWDPACGIGRIAEAARHTGYRTIATDIVDRGYSRFDGVLDFFDSGRVPAANICTNPPFTECDLFVRHALEQVDGKIAMIWPTR